MRPLELLAAALAGLLAVGCAPADSELSALPQTRKRVLLLTIAGVLSARPLQETG